MAIVKRKGIKGVTYQLKIRDTKGLWVTKTFATRAEAKLEEAALLLEKTKRGFISVSDKKLILNEYFKKWDEKTQNLKVSKGWRATQRQMYRDYIETVLGKYKLMSITTENVMDVLNKMIEMKRSPQTQRHVYSLLHKLFADAVELFNLSIINPVKRSLNPSIPEKESPYHIKEDCIKLLNYVKGKPFGLAIWIQLYGGLRVGEVQTLRWKDIDFLDRKIHVRSTYDRKEKKFKDCPKGKKWYPVPLSPELYELLLQESKGKDLNAFVVKSSKNPKEFMSYGGYYKALLRYCKDTGLLGYATHALRHSTSGLYDAGIEEMAGFFNHSDIKVTKRYVHNRSTKFDDKVRDTRILPVDTASDSDCSQMFPNPKTA